MLTQRSPCIGKELTVSVRVEGGDSGYDGESGKSAGEYGRDYQESLGEYGEMSENGGRSQNVPFSSISLSP